MLLECLRREIANFHWEGNPNDAGEFTSIPELGQNNFEGSGAFRAKKSHSPKCLEAI